MSYTVAVALGVAGALALDLWLLRTAVVRRGVFWVTYAVVLGFQLLSNGVLSGQQVVFYDPARITGVRVVFAPVEDLALGFAMVLVTLSVWVWLGRRAAAGRDRALSRPGRSRRPRGR